MCKLFAVPFAKCLGVMEKDNSLHVLQITSKDSFITMGISTKSEVKPHTTNDGVLLAYSGTNLELSHLSISGDRIKETTLMHHSLGDDLIKSVFIQGNVASIISMQDTNYVLGEFGQFQFAIAYCKAIATLYNVIG